MTGQGNMGVGELDDTEEFLLHYQLKHDPFMSRPPGFRFFTPGRKPVLAQLHHMAHFSEQLQVVIGPSGSGKTLLRQAMVASCNRDKVQCIVTSGREHADATSLGNLICQALNVGNTAALLERAEQLHAIGMQMYLVVDDGHCLEPAAVQLLADLSQAGRSAPRVFLFAEDSVVDLLEAVEIPGERGWLQLVELAPFTLDETRGYLAQRLEGAGQGIELLDDQQIAHIHRLSGGWPGAINQVARQVMLEDVHEPTRPAQQKRAGLPVRSLVALVLVGAGVVIAWLMGGDEPEPTQTVLNLPEQVTTLDVSDRPVLQMPGDTGNTLERIVEEPDSESEGLADVLREAAPAVTVDTVAELPEPVAMPAPPPIEAPQVVAAPEPAVTAPVASQAPAAVPTPVAETAPSAPARSESAATPAPPSAANRTNAAAYHRDAWYRQRAANEYTLQLLGTRSRQAAEDFVRKQAGLTDIGYFETLHEGKPWFVVTQGAYAGRSQAQQGIARLPEALQKQKPWLRSMGSIQQSLR
ncbi:MAG: SPOR domain-containing protein [Pseudomonas sp.]